MLTCVLYERDELLTETTYWSVDWSAVTRRAGRVGPPPPVPAERPEVAPC